MIPVRLAVKDFLSYADPGPIAFETFQVACLSGDNGVGKSALLDAITWSIWASARGCEGGQNQDRLIRDGADEMTVDFTFDLGDARYRIVRRRSRAGKAELQFLVRDDAGWKNIAGESLKETDAKIAAVLRMDYKTFTASAFFLQGRSDDFLARMKPDERKDVFARLLDLGTYERLEDAARARARDAESQRKVIAARIDELAASTPDVEALASELERSRGVHAALETQIGEKTAQLDDLRERLTALRSREAALRAERETLTTIERAATDAAEHISRGRAELAELDSLLSRRDEVAAALAEAERVAEAEAEARDRQERAADLDRERAELLAEIDGERRLIEERIATARRRIAALETEEETFSAAERDLVKIDAAIEDSADLASSLEATREVLASLTAEGARLKEQIAQLEASAAKAERNLDVLSDGGGECPVCGSALDATHRTKVKRDIEKEIRQSRKARDAATASLEVARKEAIRATEEIKRLASATAERERLVAMREGVVAKLERVAVVAEELATHRAAIVADELLLTDASFAGERRARLAELEATAAGLYDATAHAQLRERLEHLQAYAPLAGKLEDAASRRERLVADIDTASARASEFADRVAASQATIAALTDEVAELPDTAEAVAAVERSIATERKQLGDATTVVARLEERLAVAQRAADELGSLRTDERIAAGQHRRYRRLMEAFGRGGIPDLIIDNALPELEDEANRILGRLSDHEMSVHFVLQRDTKGGKVKETFEALVHHDGGIRDFAMFSGGEAFRVAFAVRLAMSKLLVRRAGARLETLVIDEGFGTQDPEGRERLVEAINLARDEFGKVLVITHLDELKDQFGAQIRVTKGRDGSSLELIGS